MAPSPVFLTPSRVAGRLGLSAKALRLYEARGLIAPSRTAAGWRTYGPGDMARLTRIMALRDLGLSLAQIGQVLRGDAEQEQAVLARHRAALQNRIGALSSALQRIGEAPFDPSASGAPETAGIDPSGSATQSGVTLDLPWPWGGERFELRALHPLTFITGPLGSGKTRLARLLAERLPAAFLGLDRLAQNGSAARARLREDPSLGSRVDEAMAGLVGDGATASDALIALLAGLDGHRASDLVVDMVEQGLDRDTQHAVMAYLRRTSSQRGRLLLLTRSSVVLDLAAVGPDEGIIYCPANHAPPMLVPASPGAPGFESVSTCLATPAVRARTDGVVAWRPAEAARSA